MKKEIIKQLPKVDLHCHLDGSVPLETLKRLAEKEGFSKESMLQAIAPDKCKDLKEYLKSFDVILSVLQTRENLYDATYETIAHIAQENVMYLELRFAPLLHQEKGLTIDVIITTVCQAIDQAMQDYAIHVNLLICAMRHHQQEQHHLLLETIQALKKGKTCIVGFDFAGDEAAFSNQTIAPYVRSAKNNGLQITLHSGECGCPHEVVEAIKLGAVRIGHGIAIKDDENALTTCVQSGVLLEMCPTSNVQTNAVSSLEDYPLQAFIKKGVQCSINTDNRTVSNTTLTQEFLLLSKHCGLDYQQMKCLTLNAMTHAFVLEQTKDRYIKQITDEFFNIIGV